MNFLQICVFSTLVLGVASRGVNGGMSCAVCTVVTGLVMQVAELHDDDLVNVSKRFCNFLPNYARSPCLKFVNELAPHLTNLSERITPDVFCAIYGTCEVDQNGNLCHLFPLNLASKQLLEQDFSRAEFDFCELPYIKEICQILNNSFISLSPLEDFDGDGFSALETGRGFDWRGRDCADNNEKFYPGAVPRNSDLFADSNCNGIWGFSQKDLTAWEQTLCKKSQPRGLIFIGDSIGAHFHMPEVWINPLMFSWPGLNGSDVILDELDWPQFGFATGFRNISQNILIKGYTDSIYLKLKARNRCNHRDYQNLSQNGASSYDALNHARAISRNQTLDHPALVLLAMQGNDVCNNFNETSDHSTPPRIFKKNILETLHFLEMTLPRNSNVVLVELVEADFIFDAMAETVHPIGKLHQNVFYKDMYKWFNCLQIGPCTGWLNSNKTLRLQTTQKAQKLNKVLRQLVQQKKFQNFGLYVIKNPITYLVKKKGINVSEFLEPVDSLHPNQGAQPLLAQVTWKFLQDLPSNVLGPENPNNERIKDLFGNQGGH